MKSKQIKLTTTSYAVMALLEMLGEGTPYALKQALERSVENFWPVPHTTFYDEPARLANAGYLSERREDGGRRRRVYALTDAGYSALRAWADSPELAPQQLRDEGLLKIFAGADPRVVFAKRAEWHRVKLAELEGYLEGCREPEPARGSSGASARAPSSGASARPASSGEPPRAPSSGEAARGPSSRPPAQGSSSAAPSGVEMTLLAGTAFHRQMLALIEPFLASGAGEEAAAAGTTGAEDESSG